MVAKRQPYLRKRQIDGRFWIDDKVCILPLSTRVAFMALWCLADRKGRLPDEPERLRKLAFPDQKHAIDLEEEIKILAGHGMVVRYQAEGEGWLFLPNFEKYQPIHPNEMQSKCPAPDSAAKGKEAAMPSTYPKEIEALSAGFQRSLVIRDFAPEDADVSKTNFYIMLYNDVKRDPSLMSGNVANTILFVLHDQCKIEDSSDWSGWYYYCRTSRLLREKWSEIIRGDGKQGVYDAARPWLTERSTRDLAEEWNALIREPDYGEQGDLLASAEPDFPEDLVWTQEEEDHIFNSLREQVDAENYDTWIKPMVFKGWAEGSLWFSCPSAYSRSWLDRFYRDRIEEIGNVEAVNFVIDEQGEKP